MLKKLPAASASGRHLECRPGAGMAASIMQDIALSAPHLSVTQPGLVRVVAGTKDVKVGRKRLGFPAGAIALFAGGKAFDVTNTPAADGPYRAEAIFFESPLLPPLPAAGTKPVADIASLAAVGPELAMAFDVAHRAITDVSLPLSIVRHRLGELLLWLNESGVSLVAPRAETVEQRIRLLVAQDPAFGWTGATIANALAVSEATLRRRLAERRTSWTDVLQDVRLTAALTLLQSTDSHVAAVAARVGYESPSRFAARFRERFGVAPSRLRGRPAD
ncbi:MAG: helix-turn-helix transcriptional regulator [Proteobacteria bacterium]|nr:helix-turn-helix transcriptional regulator [Pseudomonadota bacterium]